MKLQAEQVEVQGKRFVDSADTQVFLIIRSYSKLSVKSILTFSSKFKRFLSCKVFELSYCLFFLADVHK